VYAQAVSLADAGKPADGLALLQSAAKANEKNLPAVQWDLPIVQYRQATADPGTATAWAKLTDAYPGDLTVQNAALNAPWRYDHRDGWLKAINRLKALTNDNATGWRLEMARYVLDDPAAPDEKSLSETVNDLAAMKRQNPDAIEPRLLLATAWIRAKNIPYAITQLEEAWQLRPNDADIGLQLYDLLRKQGRLDDARSYLQRLGTSKTLDAASRVRVAAALADMGQTQRAIDLLNEEPNPGPLSDNLLARLQRRLGNEDQAAKIYARWLTAPNPDAAILQSAADFFASGDQTAQAAKYLARLPEVKLPPGRSQIILSQYQENHGSKDEAAKLLAQATALAPDDVSAWLAQAGFEIRAHRYDQAQSIAAEGLRHLPGNVDLSTLQEQAKVMAAGQSADLQPLVELLSRDPHNAAGVATLKLLTDARSTNTADSQLLARMRKLADQYP
jgi:predicted Zn-dependent protease